MTTTQTLPAIGTTVTASQPGSHLQVTGAVVGHCSGDLTGYVEVEYANRHGGRSTGRFHASRCETVHTSEEEVTEEDRETMRRARGAIVRHLPTGGLGWLWPHEPLALDFVVVEDYRD